MTRHCFLAFASLLLGVSTRAAEPARPNVLFIAVDDLKPLLGCYGTDVPTPNIDRLASAGTTFLNAHCQQAVCGPSRASLLTGQRPDYTQIWDLKTLIRDKRPDIVTLPQYFRSHGYQTTGSGKIYDPRSVDQEQDAPSWSIPFTETFALPFKGERGAPIGGYLSDEVRTAYGALAKDGRKPTWNATKNALSKKNLWRAVECLDVPDNAYEDGAIADYAERTLPGLVSANKPFFLAIGFKKPHLPFVAPKKYWDLFDRDRLPLAVFREQAAGSPAYAYHKFEEMREYSDIPQVGPLNDAQARELIHGYYACVAYIDAQVGRVLDALEKTGAAQNTVIVLWGDHGWHLGDHGLWCKHTNFEQSTHAPLILSAPQQKAPGGKVTAPVEFVDIFPTLCQLTGLPVPADLAGQSLVPSLANPAAPTKDFAISQFPRGPRMGYAMRSSRYRLVAWFNVGDGQFSDGSQAPEAVELYDYETDPLETRSLADSPEHKAIAEKMLARLREFLAAQKTK